MTRQKPNIDNGKAILLDDLDMKIAYELLDDSNSSSSDIARKHDTPLSTIQRRRTRLERTVLTKDYTINTEFAGQRSGEIFMHVEKGKAEAVGKQLFDRYENNVTLVSTTMNNVGNLIGHLYYTTSPEMFSIIEDLRRIEFVQEVMYAEHIEKLGERKPRFILESLRKNKNGKRVLAVQPRRRGSAKAFAP